MVKQFKVQSSGFKVQGQGQIQFKSIFPVFFFLFLGLFCLNISSASAALEEDEVLVIANSWADDSVSLAKYYMKKRGVPKANLLKIKVAEKEV